MRVARLVGLSPDGWFLIVATDSGEELAIAADDRLRAAVRGDRPRLGQLEIEMESALSPREIQTRIRSGESLEDVTRVAGIEPERVERFAAPVLAERDHVARLAQSSSVRRRGETSAHRVLRAVLDERLRGRGVDIDTVRWDSHRLADGRWAVTADYRSGEADRQAIFLFDVSGRFSVAGNDDARWILGEQSPAKGPQPGRRRSSASGEEGTDDTEPTLDLSDELALVRAVQEPPDVQFIAEPVDDQTAGASVHPLRPVPTPQLEEPPAPEPEAAEAGAEAAEPEPAEAEGEVESEGSQLDELYEMFDEPTETSPEEARQPVESAELLASAEPVEAEEISVEREEVTTGPSDAAAVPATPVLAPVGWEPAIVVNYPIEPSQVEPEDDEPAAEGGTDEPGPPDAPTNISDREDEVHAFDESHVPADAALVEPTPVEAATDEAAHPVPVEPTPPAKPARRKRAAVPSWDEIMFGGPKSSG